LLGLPPGTMVAPEQGVALPTSVVPPPREELERGLEARRLDLLALRRGYDSAEAALRAAVIAQFPRLSIGANRARDTGDVTTNGLSFTLGLPIFDRNQAQVAAATATRAQLFDEYAARVFEARAELAAADERIRALDRRIEAARADEATFRRLEETYRDALARGQATALEYVQAWTNEQNARRRGLALQGELVEARVRLELAGGLYRVDGAAATAAEPKGR
ncbi:MAG: TolC family protein, partial [Candidatus Polarisedimenticolia bacterium]